MFDQSLAPADRPSPGIRRMCVFGDARSYSTRDALGQIEVQRALTTGLGTACERARIDRAHWIRQEQGDGELALLPPGIDEAWTLNGLVRELRAWLYHYNRDRNDEARLRVRLAVHEGIVYAADNGFAGEAVVTLTRLCNASAAKQALTDNPRADLVVIVSERIFNDVVSQNLHELLADDFSEVRVDDPAKGFRERAWVALPGRAADRTDRSTVTNTQGDVSGEAVAARDTRDVNIHDQQGDHHGDQYGSQNGDQRGDRFRDHTGDRYRDNVGDRHGDHHGDHHGDRYDHVTVNQPGTMNVGGKHDHGGRWEGS
ncbi:hypothetical protein ACIBFB_25895 [Nocardiopsis sp. NPDC050513]|uniref:hypothetical protein n=1 Tax=Nocardiopsis sp. NPDC050513 TaxID=3364338 RepID=UPI00378B3A89